MFEGSLVESRGLVVSGARKWTALGSLALQCGVVALLLTIPMVRPDSMPLMSVVPRLSVTAPLKPAPMPVRLHTSAEASSAMSVPAPASSAATTRVFTFPRPGALTEEMAPSVNTSLFGWGSGSSTVLSAASSAVPGPVAVTRVRDVGPLRVSKGVSEGMLLAPIRPVYPPIAKAAGIGGAVVLEAVISKAGQIESIHVLSGPDMLRRAAIDAVQAARYAPYKLSGEAVAVETTITVVFQLRN